MIDPVEIFVWKRVVTRNDQLQIQSFVDINRILEAFCWLVENNIRFYTKRYYNFNTIIDSIVLSKNDSTYFAIQFNKMHVEVNDDHIYKVEIYSELNSGLDKIVDFIVAQFLHHPTYVIQLPRSDGSKY